MSKTTEKKKRKKPVRRMGPSGSPTWHAILDAGEDILQNEGYAALNARRIAERAGIKRQLVYYYFHDNDDLIVQLFHRLADQLLARMNLALESAVPMRETWDMGINTLDATLIAEVTALANRNEAVREAVVQYVSTSRQIQVAALEKALHGRPLPEIELPPVVITLIATHVALGLKREADIGITDGHQEMCQVIEDFLEAMDGSSIEQREPKRRRKRQRR